MSRKYSQLPPNARAIIWCAVSTTKQASEDRASMEEQERWAVNVCRDNNWKIVDILRVPGHSRNYKDIYTLAKDARAKGIDAFDKLIVHLERSDFDVFLCRDANRFARRASLLHYLVESIVEDCDAVIYSQNDGWVDKQNASGFAAMKGYSTTQDISWIRKGLDIGRKKRVKNGLPASGPLSTSHKFIRDPETGKIQNIVINDNMRFLYQCIGELLLEGLTWSQIKHELYARWGLTSATGTLYSQGGLYYRMYNPIVWGNLVMGRNQYPVGEWIFYPHPSKPDDIEVHYDIVPPLYTGLFGLSVRSELIRRIGLKGGSSRPASTYRFSGLCVCGLCGNIMTVASKAMPRRGYIRLNGKKLHRYNLTEHGMIQWGLKCKNKGKHTHDGEEICTNTQILQATVEDFLSELFVQILSGRTLNELMTSELTDKDVPPINVYAEIQKIEGQIKTLIVQQSLAPDMTQGFYQEQILQLSKQLQILREKYNESVRVVKVADGLSPEYLKNIDLDKIWEMNDLELNRFLKRGLGDYRLIAIGDKVIGIKKL